MITFEHAIHLVELLAALGILGYLKKIARLLSLFVDFPPHRHMNGKILYPKGYEPAELEDLKV